MKYDLGETVMFRKKSGPYKPADRMQIIRSFACSEFNIYVCVNERGEVGFFKEDEILNPNEELVHQFDEDKKEWQIG